ncbi:phosphate signaling complex protein PhoU [Paenibacillus shunpengii]|uniref:Phosphate-specific transport system accessory protein PhoU n=1 Tax=Paenibacillus shunpengii TaxID=2054424 RepID=A0ABW5SJH2_9BACL|nr:MULTISPECIES: phosphate signaling complex protein PhoU [unclassified Paenibacillus]OMC71289.1 phosphate transport system regulatory protein PhoU [Paenibacillus sp. FSL H7-0326]SDW25502.1 phosphate uptake regulator, PhoU [Paenibacillus sp. PDC88]
MIRRKSFDRELNELRDLLLQMAEHVNKALVDSITSLKTSDQGLAQKVVSEDVKLNAMEERIMDIGTKLIITQQPVAKDLRRIIVAFKISSDLERMGDLALDVAKVTLRLEGQELIKPLIDIPQMADIVKVMIDESIQSYLEENSDLAYQMAKRDDGVDQLYSRIITDLYSYMADHPQDASQVMLLMLVGRYIERIGDHATNIGESTVYLVTGKRPDLNQ